MGLPTREMVQSLQNGNAMKDKSGEGTCTRLGESADQTSRVGVILGCLWFIHTHTHTSLEDISGIIGEM